MVRIENFFLTKPKYDLKIDKILLYILLHHVDVNSFELLNLELLEINKDWCKYEKYRNMGLVHHSSIITNQAFNVSKRILTDITKWKS